MAETDDLRADLADFRRRVQELRAARTLPPQERLAALDAALFELRYAADVLWPRYEQRDAARPAGDGGGMSGARERQLLRELFERLPLAVVLLDAEGVVRRLNAAASQLFGMRAGYATGRSLSASLRHEVRAAFRGQVAAVARREGDRSMVVELLRNDADARGLRVTLTEVRPPGQRRGTVLAVFQPTAQEQTAAAVPRGGGLGRELPDPAEVDRHTELMDLLDAMTTALLTHPSAGDEHLLHRACQVLRGRFADWVIADAAPAGGGRLRRVVVLGPGDGPREAVAGQDPATAPLIGQVARSGRNALHVLPQDTLALGEGKDGASVLALTEASSLLCVPLPLPSGTVRGVLTLIRSGGRPAFELAEAGAMDRMARHIALTTLHSA